MRPAGEVGAESGSDLDRTLLECSNAKVEARGLAGSGRMQWRASSAHMEAQAHRLTAFLLAEDCIE